jgi:hypothetical protein
METKIKKNKVKFVMDTDWVFKGVLDSEEKRYILLNYFQKLNKNLEEIKIYPMFTELSLHLGNIQTLLTRNQILYTDKKFTSNDEELMLTDLKVKDVPEMTDKEYEEYQKILKYSQPKLFDYFNITKSLWMVVYENINVNVKKNKNNLSSKGGFFYYESSGQVRIWRYTTRKVVKLKNQYKTKIDLIYEGGKNDLTILEIISKFSSTFETKNEKKYPVFEVTCKDIFPLNETLIPIFKRKVLAYIAQSVKSLKSYEENGIQ